ncbi:hypothetical protein DJ018_04610 [Phenylobacterium deserti]|uniref:Uncharacterized protein n=1 Tax=Phenylobacterium deserti TaxID=1914756 RepID=A0A328ASE4_9CAUL|nr:hypothetical protein DJ018_04610 [Phenylobacterium deserti]
MLAPLFMLKLVLMAPLQTTDMPPPKSTRATHGPSARFATLDAYLEFLETRAQLGGTWYRQVAPGLYQRESGNLRRADGAAPKRTYTRAELAEKFGFPP